jgi:hypothetical protein
MDETELTHYCEEMASMLTNYAASQGGNISRELFETITKTIFNLETIREGVTA